VSSLARDGLMKIIRRAIKQSHEDDFKVHEFNVLGNHLHLITTAAAIERRGRPRGPARVSLECC
jgi:REP element-mobilizing transposase RayT